MGEIVSGGQTHFGFVTGLPMSARENEAFDNLQGKFFSGPSAEEVILLNDFAKEIDPKNPKGLIGQEVTLRYGERQALAADSDSTGRPQLSGAPAAEAIRRPATTSASPSCARRRS